MASRKNVLDRSLVTLHRIHHQWILVKQSQHRKDRIVPNFNEQYLVLDLVKANVVLSTLPNVVNMESASTAIKEKQFLSTSSTYPFSLS